MYVYDIHIIKGISRPMHIIKYLCKFRKYIQPKYHKINYSIKFTDASLCTRTLFTHCKLNKCTNSTAEPTIKYTQQTHNKSTKIKEEI